MLYKTLAHPSHQFNIQDALLAQHHEEGWTPINYHLITLNGKIYRVIQLQKEVNHVRGKDEAYIDGGRF